MYNLKLKNSEVLLLSMFMSTVNETVVALV